MLRSVLIWQFRFVVLCSVALSYVKFWQLSYGEFGSVEFSFGSLGELGLDAV